MGGGNLYTPVSGIFVVYYDGESVIPAPAYRQAGTGQASSVLSGIQSLCF